MVSFPLKRPNPVPDITTKEEFILYYPALFDEAFKTKLSTTKFVVSDFIIRYPNFGILSGEIWLDENGKIITINHESPEEKKLAETLKSETEKTIHQSVTSWKENILVCKTDKFLIRIDLLDNDELRYVSWSVPKSISEKPDLILLNGKEEFQGTMGGVTYTFKNGDWAYEIDRVNMAESEEDMGLFLRLYKDEKLVSTYKCVEGK